ncbi:beta-mannosidase-like [Liolophura sinensis]|uniref:beta-mannosidase-like n=1 Tax=Liolophura sinensis TaxID=3198878 RepID=UPI0031587FDE
MKSSVVMLTVVLLYSLLCVRTEANIWDLGGQWKVYNVSSSQSIKAWVPGTIYTALSPKVIGEPYYRFNDDLYRWVATANWTYSRQFTATSEMLAMERLQLICDGVDTVSDIYINDRYIGSTKDAFLQYVFDVKDMVVAGENTIDVRLQSPVSYAMNQSANYPYLVPPKCPPEEQHGWCYVNFIRKPQFSFSWDWAPSFPTSGIWRNISIHGYQGIDFRYITIETTKALNYSGWMVNAKVFYELSRSSVDTVVTYSIPNLHCQGKFPLTLKDDAVFFLLTCIVADNVELWWPRGYGAQPLYTLVVEALDTSGTPQAAKIVRFGFRTVDVEQYTPADTHTGLTFSFIVNEIPIFAKGSNWVPADSFQERVTSSYRRRLLQSAADANMNMLRICAVGIYEHDEFYDIADELGLMIFHDIVGFNCAMYPRDPDFLTTVTQEVTHQVRRLQHHPSIVIWSGNNKNELGLALNLYGTNSNFTLYKSDYLSLYIDTIMTVVEREDGTRTFIDSSPNNGARTVQDGWVSQNPNDTLYGTVDHFEYDHDAWDWTVYPVGRFVTEYGLQSWPSLTTLKTASEPQDWNYDSPFCEHRQHSVNGLVKYGKVQRPVKEIRDIIYLTQINQAIALKTYSELLRRRQNEAVNGEGFTMGALFWQLEDIWQAPTWASIEYGGKWKMLHYYAVRFFSDTLISPYIDQSELKVYYIQDFPSVPRKANDSSTNVLNIRVRSWSSFTVQYRVDVPFLRPSQRASSIYNRPLSTILANTNCPSKAYCFLEFGLNENFTTGNWLLLTYPKDTKGLHRASIKIGDPHLNQDGTFTLQLSSTTVAMFVWLDTGVIEGRFSDNGFIMSEPSRDVVFYPWQNVSVVDLKTNLTVTSLANVYE